ncbi:helix-turn-helix domain-containing protein [Streptomyces sp. NPDC057654]|uniref:helix-turn-helix domain-containing protein n=1 Tax=Streptomyces sp. NPDC057654 TaxID=3346196 RepID=UPI0036A63DF8
MNRKELNPEASPQAAYGARLRSLREARGWTQDDLAAHMDYSSVHISGVETGRKSPTLRFSRGVDSALGLVGAGESFEREYREIKHGSLLEGFPEYVGYEGRAVEIRIYNIGIIPGLLQTPDYARVLADSAARRGAITPEHADKRVTFLMERQAALERQPPPMLFVVLDESCIRRPVGGPEVMNAQLERLIECAACPTTILQVAPYDIGERRTFDLPVNLLTMPDRSVVAYAESQAQGNVDREPAIVLPMLTAYHQLQGEALSKTASALMMKEIREVSS